ncbi:MAG TPA: hypothetical protein PLJ43_02725 [Chitinophagales bacterium]|nr:hypothetical protein [Chitinophagales bacterium]
MDAVTAHIVSGAAAGFVGGCVNIYLWQHTLRHKKLLGVKLHKGFAAVVADILQQIPEKFDTKNLRHIEKDILDLFDHFMSDQLTKKMPVLSMFMDEKLIAEIRTIFKMEMESHLPKLLMNRITAEKNIAMVAGLVAKAVRKGLRQYAKHAIIYILLGTLGGALVGYAMSFI